MPRKFLPPFVALSILLSGCTTSQVTDRKLPYFFTARETRVSRLNSVKIRKMDGSQVEAWWLGVHGDSLLLADRYSPLPGATVKVTTLSGQTVKGVVQRVKDPVIAIRKKTQPEETVFLNNVEKVKVIAYVSVETGGLKIENVGASTVKSVHFTRITDAGNGALIGALAGAAVFATVESLSQSGPGQNTLVGNSNDLATFSAGLIGAVGGGITGALIGSSGRTHRINGSSRRLREEVSKIRAAHESSNAGFLFIPH